jgi:Fe-S-cluster-containing dehydrogenase component
MNVNRRDFMKFAGLAGGSLLAGTPRRSEAAVAGVEFSGLLIDTTKCIGCRSCEEACNAKNRLPEPEESFSSERVFERERDTTPEAYTVLNRRPNPKDPDQPIFVRKQCMHCNQPACASACLVKALEKTKEGPVIYNKDRCMGCRYCMISCPYDIPKFEYGSPLPYIRKCQFCFDKLAKGEQTACAEACPEGATLFGNRRELLEIARERIYQNPGKYVPHIYGEHEVGGSSVLYLSSVPFEKLGFRTDLGTTPYPEHTSGFLYGVPLVFVLWPSILVGLNILTNRNNKENDHE